MAEKLPNKIALSHNAHGNTKLVNGRAVIHEIQTVYSVDLVGDKPGTTNGLFECNFPLPSESQMPLTNPNMTGDLRTPQLRRADADNDPSTEQTVVDIDNPGELRAYIQSVLEGDEEPEAKLNKISNMIRNADPVMEDHVSSKRRASIYRSRCRSSTAVHTGRSHAPRWQT